MYSIKVKIQELRVSQDNNMLGALASMAGTLTSYALMFFSETPLTMWIFTATSVVTLTATFILGMKVYGLTHEIEDLKEKQSRGEEFTS